MKRAATQPAVRSVARAAHSSRRAVTVTQRYAENSVAVYRADEAGLKGFEVSAWHGIYAPKGTPDAIVQKLSATLQAALKDPDLVKRFNDINTDPVSSEEATPKALKTLLDSEVDRWAPIIKAAGQFAD